MIALPRQITCQNIMAVAREQAWSNARQVLGLPTRLGDEPEYQRHWDLTAIGEVLDQAVALQWGPEELTAWDRDGRSHRFAIRRPGGNENVSGRSWTMTCPAPYPDCARPQDAALSRADAEALASDHDGLHHGGAMTAEVAPTPEMVR